MLDIWDLYRLMLLSRRYEEEVQQLWEEGKIFGEMHLGIGEEAIVAGIVSQLIDGDALALDHRGTPPLLMRGVDPVKLLLEFLGNSRGLCAGLGGHMHLFSKEHLAASSGIVGASGPAAVGFALSANYKKTSNIAVAFFGEGSMNQGMLMESMNLASAWNLPVLFVCKDNTLAITTVSKTMTGGVLLDRAKGFGIDGIEIDGSDVRTVWITANEAISRMRENGGPYFIHAHCTHKTGHFLGDPLFRSLDLDTVKPLIRALVRIKGIAPHRRLRNVLKIMRIMKRAQSQSKKKQDPFEKMNEELKQYPNRQKEIESTVEKQIDDIITQTMKIFEKESQA
jgi:pyruvate dehydrogenase E1 component alpha subunit